MKTFPLAQTDLVVSRIAYGCGYLADEVSDPMSTAVVDSASRTIRAACDQGINFFDMAAMYARGKVEIAFGAALRRSPGLREKLVLQSKCGAVDSSKGTLPPRAPWRHDLSFDGIIASAEGSLERLGTDRLDSPAALVGCAGTARGVARAFDELHRAGKIRYFGVSNHIASASAVGRQSGGARIGRPHLIGAGFAQLESAGMRIPKGHEAFNDVVDYCRLTRHADSGLVSRCLFSGNDVRVFGAPRDRRTPDG